METKPPPRPPCDPVAPSFSVTFPEIKVGSGPDPASLDQLMKSEEYKAFREDDKALDGFTVEMFKLYSGAIIAVATGVFVGTISVVKEMSSWRCNGLLGSAWGLTTIAVVAAFVELLLSQFGSYREKDILAWRLKHHDYQTERSNGYSDWCRYLMVATCLTLAMGVVFSALFIFLNRNAPRRSDESRNSAPGKGLAACPFGQARGPNAPTAATGGEGEQPSATGQHGTPRGPDRADRPKRPTQPVGR